MNMPQELAHCGKKWGGENKDTQQRAIFRPRRMWVMVVQCPSMMRVIIRWTAIANSAQPSFN